MTRLCQMIIEQRPKALDPWHEASERLDTVRELLQEPNADERYNLIRLERRPERFIFRDNPTKILISDPEMRRLTNAEVMRLAHFPCDNFWLEWPTWDEENNPLRVGALVLKEGARRRIYLMREARASYDFNAIVCVPQAVMFTNELPVVKDASNLGLTVAWVLDPDAQMDRQERLHGDDVNREASVTLFNGLIHALFLMSIPRLAELETVTPSAKLQKARRKHGKLPLVEYRTVRLRIGKAPAHGLDKPSVGTSSDPLHRRLHHVIGHARVYRKGRETPKVTWIQPHWRGDPTLGVVFADRDVTT